LKLISERQTGHARSESKDVVVHSKKLQITRTIHRRLEGYIYLTVVDARKVTRTGRLGEFWF
jgi:hypothetical protein